MASADGHGEILTILTKAREGAALNEQQIHSAARSACQLARSNKDDDKQLGLEVLDTFSKTKGASEVLLQYGAAELLVRELPARNVWRSEEQRLFPGESACMLSRNTASDSVTTASSLLITGSVAGPQRADPAPRECRASHVYCYTLEFGGLVSSVCPPAPHRARRDGGAHGSPDGS
jgi:hypothetical protein